MDALRGTLASRWWRAVFAALLTVLVVVSYVVGRDAPLINAIEGTALTWRFLLRGPVAPPGNVAIVAIDDKTVTQLKRWPLPRRAIAEFDHAVDRARHGRDRRRPNVSRTRTALGRPQPQLRRPRTP